jgi:SAM-dependent methyltransferase
MNSEVPPRLYTELAAWWPLLSPASEYAEEAADLLPVMHSATDSPPRTLLELGCGGGSLAYHLKSHFQLTLTDRSEQMLAVCRSINPECEHILGDMRSLNLDREFDIVLIHDAIMYLADANSLREALQTAYRHCRSGGATLILPDCVKETFEAGSSHGGYDGADGRGLRYLEWTWDSDPTDDTFQTAYAFLLREPDGTVRVEGDQHRLGLFSRATWLTLLTELDFSVRSRLDPWTRDVFIASKLATHRH